MIFQFGRYRDLRRYGSVPHAGVALRLKAGPGRGVLSARSIIFGVCRSLRAWQRLSVTCLFLSGFLGLSFLSAQAFQVDVLFLPLGSKVVPEVVQGNIVVGHDLTNNFNQYSFNQGSK